MRIVPTYMFAAVLCLSFTPGEEFDLGEFMLNIPNQVESAWNRMVEAIKQPVRIRRHFYRTKATTIVNTGPNEYTTLAIPTFQDFHSPFTAIPLPIRAPVIEDTTLNIKSKVPIPALGTRHPYRRMFSQMPNKGPKCNNLDWCDDAFQEYVDMNPFKSKEIHLGKSQELFEYATPGKKILIPFVRQPSYSNVNQWNNMQRPSFAQIKFISPGNKRTITSKVLEYFYNGKISENTIDSDFHPVQL